MKKLLLLAALLITSALYSQEVGVPFRVGNKFGVANAKGKMLIPATYDIVEPKTYNKNNYIVAYTFTDNGILSSLIYENKVLIGNKKYADYYINNGLIIATEYKVLRASASHSDKNFTQTDHLYDLKGKDVFKDDLKDVFIQDDIDEEDKLDVFVLYITDLNNNESVYLYDKKEKKITKTFIDSAKSISVNFDWQTNYRNRTITHIYLDKAGKGKQMVLKMDKNTIVVASETNIDYRAEQQRQEEERFNRMSVEIPYGDMPAARENSVEETKITTVRKVERKRSFYYLPKKIEEIKISNYNLDKGGSYIISKNNKQGLYSPYKNDYIIPVEYDEIIYAQFEGNLGGGHILRNGEKYGAYIYDHPDDKVIAPIFDKIPVMVNYDYFGKKQPLFKLFDENGKLFFYADENGKLFYKP